VRESLFPDLQPFLPERYELTSHSTPNGAALSSATVTIRVGYHVGCESKEGVGAVNALERCLRQCLFMFYPEIANLEVKDCRARVLEPYGGTGARVRVSLEWGESGSRWTTVGVSQDFLQAAWLALVDGFRLRLMRLAESAPASLPVAADSSWAV
jgi:2-isopropylmalate synthase